MANFRYIYGTMGAGKTQELMRLANDYERKGKKVMIFTSSLDTRIEFNTIKSRNSSSKNAVSVVPGTPFDKIIGNILNLPDCVFFDEAQFFDRQFLIDAKEYFVIKHNVPIIAFGLKADFQNKLFVGSAAGFELAEEINEIQNLCTYCNEKATVNMRLDENKNPIYNGEQIVIGGNDKYCPVCYKHWLSPVGDNQ